MNRELKIGSENLIENKLKRDRDKVLIDEYVEYMRYMKGGENLRNKLNYLKILLNEINKEVLDGALELEIISDGKLNDEESTDKINKLEEIFFNVLRERQIFNDAEEKLGPNQK